jgi:hypothetical protein
MLYDANLHAWQIKVRERYMWFAFYAWNSLQVYALKVNMEIKVHTGQWCDLWQVT